jgi:hypothetical protein
LTGWYYRHNCPLQDAPLIKRMREFAEDHRSPVLISFGA